MSTKVEPAVEVRSSDLWLLVRRRWLVLVVTACVVFGGACALLAIIKVQYQATAVLRVGQFYDIAAKRMRLAEAVPIVVERIRQGDLVKAAVESLPEDLRQGIDAGDAVRPEALPSEGLILITVRAPSKDAAKRLAEAVTDRLQEVHGQIDRDADTLSRGIKDGIANSINQVRRNREELLAAISGGGDATSPAAVVARSSVLAEAVRLDLRVDELNQRLAELDSLAKFEHYSTGLFGTVAALNKPVSPNSKLIVFIGAMLGLGLGLFAALLTDYASRRRPTALAD